MNRSTISLAGAAAALVVLTGAASLTGGGDSKAAAPASRPTRLPVQRSSLLCPAPSPSESATTAYTSYTPPGSGAAGSAGSDAKGSARLVPATAKGKAFTPLKTAGKPAGYTVDKADAPALIGTADGPLAPGWTVQQTSVVDSGPGRGLSGTSCVAPDTEFWFPGASTAGGGQDFLHLVNPDDAPAVVDIELYGAKGELKASTGDGITVPGGSSKPVLLSTLVAEKQSDLTVHVVVRSGRVGADLQVTDNKLGTDWLPPAARPATSLVLPGIPADATSARLVVYATGSDDADLTLRLATSTGPITPAGHETMHVKSQMSAAVDLGDVTKGDPGSLLIGSSQVHSAVPVVAALRITRGKGAKQEIAFLPATAPIDIRATAADNRAKASTLSLTATGKAAAVVKVVSSPGTSGGTAVSKTVSVKPGTTVIVAPEPPTDGKGTYAVTVEPVSGGPVYASRMLALPEGGVPMFTIQPMPDDRGTVEVPRADADLAILNQ